MELFFRHLHGLQHKLYGLGPGPVVISHAHNSVYNYLLAPGEIFSLNALIGDITPGKGYKEAPVTVGTPEVTPDEGEIDEGSPGYLVEVWK